MDLNNKLCREIKKNNVSNVRELLEQGADVNYNDCFGRSILMHSNSESMTNLLIDYGANINARDTHGNTLFIRAIIQGRFDLVSIFLARGANLNDKQDDGITSLAAAVSRDRLDIAALLIGTKIDLNITMRQTERTVLFHSVIQGTYDMTSLLITNGANVNARDRIGLTPLHVASGVSVNAPHRFLDMMELLINNGADVNDVQNRVGEAPLTMAARSGDLNTVRLLVSKGAIVDARNNAGKTALLVSASEEKKRRIDVVNFLIENGADPNAKDNNGACALMHASHAMAKMLIEKGTMNIDNLDHAGRSTLIVIVARMCENIIFIGKIEPDEGMLATIELLLASGACVNVQDAQGVSALMISAASHNEVLCELLVRHGADPLLLDSRGETALDVYARRFNAKTNDYMGQTWCEPENVLSDLTHPSDGAWSVCRSPLSPNEKQLGIDAIMIARAEYLVEVEELRREAAWSRRKAVLDVVTSHGFRPLAARAAAEAELLPELDPSAPVPPIPIDTIENYNSYLLGQVLTHDAIFKSIVSYI